MQNLFRLFYLTNKQELICMSPSSRPATTSSSTSSSLAGSSLWPPEARTRRSSEPASWSSSCPSASSSPRRAKASVQSPRRRWACVCVYPELRLCAKTCSKLKKKKVIRDVPLPAAPNCVFFVGDANTVVTGWEFVCNLITRCQRGPESRVRNFCDNFLFFFRWEVRAARRLLSRISTKTKTSKL